MNNRYIEVVPYNSNWLEFFKTEATKIKQALGENCIEIHHIGSTSVPELAAKPIIDMIPIVRNICAVDKLSMEALGYMKLWVSLASLLGASLLKAKI